MATLKREWVSVEQAQQWLDTYDPTWLSDQVVKAMAREFGAGKKPRWYHAIVVDGQTNICHDGLSTLRAMVQEQRGQMLWIARADDFHFSATRIERGAQGCELVTRKMDAVECRPLASMAKTSYTSVGSEADSWSRERRPCIDTLTPPRYTRADAGPRVCVARQTPHIPPDPSSTQLRRTRHGSAADPSRSPGTADAYRQPSAPLVAGPGR